MKRILEFDFIVIVIVFLIAVSSAVGSRSANKVVAEASRPIIVAPDPPVVMKTIEETAIEETLVESEVIKLVCYEEPEELFFEDFETEILEELYLSPIIEETTAVPETTTIEVVIESPKVDIPYYETTFKRDSIEVVTLAKCLYGEAGDLKSTMEKAAVIWCVLNRVDNKHPYYPDDIVGVVTQKYQFTGYKEGHPVKEHLVDIVMDVLGRWQAEHRGEENVGRVLPEDYLWFYGLTARNTFRNAYEKDKAEYWDWSLPNPYED